MRKFGIFLLTAFAVLTASIAVAQDALPGVVVVPWGDWLVGSLTYAADMLKTALVGVVTWALVRFVPSALTLIEAARVEQLIGRAVDYAIAAVPGAVKGRVTNVPVANEVLEKALEFAKEAAPALARKIADTIRPKIIARIGAAGIVPPEAAVGVVVDPKAEPAILSLVGARSTESLVEGFVDMRAA